MRKRNETFKQFERNRASRAITVQFVEPATHSIWETQPEVFDQVVHDFIIAHVVNPTGPTVRRR